MIRGLIISFLLCTFMPLNAQVAYESLNYNLRSLNQTDSKKPYLDSNVRFSSFHPNLYTDKHQDGQYYRSYKPINEKDSTFLIRRKHKERSGIIRKLFYENLVMIDTGLLHITIDPLINLSSGRDRYEVDIYVSDGRGNQLYNSIYTNTRGISLRADIGNKFSMESYFYENQAVLPFYIDSFVQERSVVPGQGRVKSFKEEGFDFSQAGAYFSYAPWKNFNLQFGHHKHFIGDGYRSLMLSDNSFNYPFLRLNLWLLKNRIAYSVMYTSFQNLDRLPTASTAEAPFRRKAGSFHNIDIFATKWLKFNLFQSMIWKTMDENGKSDINYNMFNPIIYINPALYGLDDENNAVLGIGYKADAGKKLDFYGQMIVDDNDFNKMGYQLGLAYFLVKNLRFMLEWNKVDPYTYSSSVDTNQSNMHYNQPLAHPLESGFEEILIKIDSRYRRMVFNSQFGIANFQEKGQKINEVNVVRTIVPGPNIYEESFTHKTRWFYFNIELGYLVNPATNLKVFANATYRDMSYEGLNREMNKKPLVAIKSTFFYFGIRTDLRNIYTDF